MERRVLMCAPEHFGVRYEINPWMSTRVSPDGAIARVQWDALARVYRDAGLTIETVVPHPDQPDLVFTANAGLVAGRRFLISRFRHAERRGEEPIFDAWARRAGFEVVAPPPGVFFEGAGDALFCGETLFLGHGWRTEPEVQHWLEEVLSVPVVGLKLADPRFYHLDTCFCPLGGGAALAAPVAFDADSWKLLERHVPRLIAVPEEVAVTFACNAMPVDGRLVSSGPADAMARLLEPAGLAPCEVAMSEFRKSGGAVRCLTLPLSGLGTQPPALAR